ncbi:SpoIIE family protein phosphatase [Kitasatospora sp. NPDC002040]|uniref:SpoIIE family protein phosphatase n=1 Tax=Kitasatospora sp. NPDC002040 TaxID=3154661 RepID=UPI00331AA387
MPERQPGVRTRHVLDPEVFDTAVVAVALLTGPEHDLVYTNTAFTGLFGPHRVGLPARQAFPEPEAEPFLDLLDTVRDTNSPRQVTTARTTAPREPVTPRHFVYSCSPVTTRQGAGILAIAVDTTNETQALQRYEALVHAVSQMVWVMRPDGTMHELVPGWERVTGTPWRTQADGAWYDRIHPRDRGLLRRAWAEAADPPTVFECVFRARTATGEYRHLRTRAVPVLQHGRVAEWIGATADVEDGWRTRLRQRLLARIAATAGPGLKEAFGAMASAVVPDLTDACLILLLPHDEDALAGHPPSSATRIATATRPGLPPPPALRHQELTLTPLMQEIIRDRTPRTFLLAPGRPVPPDLVPEVSARWLETVGATSLTLIPLIVDDTTLAYAAVASCGDSPPPGPGDTELLRDILHHAQQPLRKVLDHQKARQTALSLQRAHLTRPPEVTGATVAACYRPASSTSEIGGDWYDAFLHPDGTLVLDIGDVAGHDLGAATAMGQMRSMLRALAYNHPRTVTPGNVLRRLDTVAEGLATAPFATAVHSHLTRRPDGHWNLAWSNAGHPPPLLLPAHGPPRYLTAAGADLPLCVDASTPRATHHRVLAPGDTLLLYTDGLIETPTTTLTLGLARLAATADVERRHPLPELLHRLQALADGRDDVAMIAFRPAPEPV